MSLPRLGCSHPQDTRLSCFAPFPRSLRLSYSAGIHTHTAREAMRKEWTPFPHRPSHLLCSGTYLTERSPCRLIDMRRIRLLAHEIVTHRVVARIVIIHHDGSPLPDDLIEPSVELNQPNCATTGITEAIYRSVNPSVTAHSAKNHISFPFLSPRSLLVQW